MSIDTVLSRIGLVHQDPHSLEAQLHAMRREVRRIGKSLSQQAGHTADDWGDQLSDFTREATRNGVYLAERAGEQAWRGAKTIRRDPLPVLAVLGTTLLLARLLQRR